eukprot:CAMPEP_0172860692 /NCGR_PEP_ID=MMETSP1075-20121228/72233_1 /TAXON_ID=2916 /ORGANISM="Ceratium fusus, Strain PA161109" /LENGTH=117 /DNA_ID=CAMNT_0013708749 /DNA_START=109 /DNA_END=462 /DNA_ORIENTATION=-
MAGMVHATEQPSSMAILSVDASGNARLMRRAVPPGDEPEGPVASDSAITNGVETSGFVELQAGRGQDGTVALGRRMPPDVIVLHLESGTRKSHTTIDESEDEEDRRLFGIKGPPDFL